MLQGSLAVLQGSLARFSALVGSSGSDFPPEQKTLVASLPANVILSAKSHPRPSKKKTQPNHRAQCPLKGSVAGTLLCGLSCLGLSLTPVFQRSPRKLKAFRIVPSPTSETGTVGVTRNPAQAGLGCAKNPDSALGSAPPPPGRWFSKC